MSAVAGSLFCMLSALSLFLVPLSSSTSQIIIPVFLPLSQLEFAFATVAESGLRQNRFSFCRCVYEHDTAILLVSTATTHALCLFRPLCCACLQSICGETACFCVANAHLVTGVGHCYDTAAGFQVLHLVLWQRQHRPRTCSDQLRMA